MLIALADPVANHSYVAMHALNAIDAMGKKAAPLKERLKALPKSDPGSPERVRTEYTTRSAGMAADHPLTTRSSL